MTTDTMPLAFGEIMNIRDSVLTELRLHYGGLLEGGSPVARINASGFAVADSLMNGLGGALVGPDGRSPSDGAVDNFYYRVGRTAVIPIFGVLCGPKYKRISAAIRQVEADGSIDTIVFHISTPGGSHTGLEAASLDIFNAKKPTYAALEDGVYSAGIYLASQADQVFAATDVDEVGSIGSYLVAVSEERFWTDVGLDLHVAASSPRKVDMHPDRKMDQMMVDAADELAVRAGGEFARAVARGRRYDDDALALVTTGEVWPASRAMELGLIDGIERPLDLIRRINGSESGAPASVTKSTSDRPEVNDQPATPAGVTPTAAADAVKEQAVAQEHGGGGAPTKTTDPALKASEEQARDAGIRAERERSGAIRKRGDAFSHVAGIKDLVDTAIAEDHTVEQFDAAVLDAMAKSKKPVGAVVADAGEDHADRRAKALALVLANRASSNQLRTIAEDSSKHAALNSAAFDFGFGDGDAAADVRKGLAEAKREGLWMAGPKKIAQLCARDAGRDPLTMTDEELLNFNLSVFASARMEVQKDPRVFDAATTVGHSSSSLPAVLLDAGNKTALAAYAGTATHYDRWCTLIDAADFKEQHMPRLGGMQDLREVPEGKEPEAVFLRDRNIAVRVKKYARTVGLTIEMVKNDDLNMLAQIFTIAQNAGARLPDKLIYNLLSDPTAKAVFDNASFFSADRKNLATGANVGLPDHGKLRAAIDAMSEQKDFGTLDEDGNAAVIDVVPRFLHVARGRASAARSVVRSKVIAGQTNEVPTDEAVSDLVVLGVQYLSGNAWFITSEQGGNTNPGILSFLDGVRTAQMAEGKRGFGYQEMYVSLPGIGASLGDPEGAYRNPGA